jgi:hypothetical protein
LHREDEGGGEVNESAQTLAEAGAALREAWIEFVEVSFIEPILKPLLVLLIRICRRAE